jgi:hypothetical protein
MAFQLLTQPTKTIGSVSSEQDIGTLNLSGKTRVAKIQARKLVCF